MCGAAVGCIRGPVGPLAVRAAGPQLHDRINPRPHTCVCVLQLWDVSAVLVVRWLCTRWGSDWLRHNWPAVAGPLAAALFIGEVRTVAEAQPGASLTPLELLQWQPLLLELQVLHLYFRTASKHRTCS